MSHKQQAGKRRFKIRYIIWMVLLAGLLAFGGFRLYAHYQLEQRMEALRAQGYPMAPTEMNAWYRDRFSRDSDDAWPLYLDAFAVYVEWKEESQENLPGYNDQIEYKRGQSWASVHLQEAQAFLADNAECLDLLHEAAGVGYSFRPLDFSQGYNMTISLLSETRECAKLLRLRAQVAIQQGDVDQAIKTIRAIFILADSAKAPVTIMIFIQRALWQLGFQSIEDLLSHHSLADAQIQSLEAVLEPIESIECFKRSLVGERCMGLSGFQAPMQDMVMLSSGSTEDRVSLPLIVLRKILGLHARDALSFVNVTQAHIEAASLPRHEARIQMSAVAKEHQDKLGPWARMLTPATARMYQVELESVGASLCARTALAVERHRLATGQVPDKLDQLVPTFMPSVPLDPFNGQTLRFRHLDKGYRIYSVGKDLADNQGQERTIGKARRGQKTWDETFTVAR